VYLLRGQQEAHLKERQEPEMNDQPHQQAFQKNQYALYLYNRLFLSPYYYHPLHKVYHAYQAAIAAFFQEFVETQTYIALLSQQISPAVPAAAADAGV
jgi:hypothetical protein